MKKQVLIVLNSLEIGGIERSLVGLVNCFDYEKYDVDIFLQSRKGEFLDQLTDKCTVLEEKPRCATLLKPVKDVVKSGHFMLAAARIAAKYQTKLKYRNCGSEDIDKISYAHYQKLWDYSVGLLPKINKKYDVALSFAWPHHYVAFNVRADKKLAWIHTDYTKTITDRDRDAKVWDVFDNIIAVSDECGAAFKKVYPGLSDKVVTVENILSPEFVRKSASEFEVPEMQCDETALLTIGRYCYAKAFDVAVDICAELVSRGQNIKWFVIGYGGGEDEIRTRAEKAGLKDKFIFLGKQKNPYPYIKACDIYVQPSRYEGKAVSVREAQMLCKPVVITNFTTAASQVKDGFDAVISPMDVKSVADDIQRLIDFPEEAEKLIRNTSASDYGNRDQVDLLYSLF
ncbi:MAG: glycosyltransferase [Clostridiales bacterium]|nr:glycosyltransferase [Clostridiales bacterium]